MPSQVESQPSGVLGELERTAVKEALLKHQGDVSRAAAALGLSRAALYRRMGKYGFF